MIEFLNTPLSKKKSFQLKALSIKTLSRAAARLEKMTEEWNRWLMTKEKALYTQHSGCMDTETNFSV